MDEIDQKCLLNWISNRVFSHNSNRYGRFITNKSSNQNEIQKKSNLKNWYTKWQYHKQMYFFLNKQKKSSVNKQNTISAFEHQSMWFPRHLII